MLTITTRNQWGFSGWKDGVTPPTIALSARTEFFVHYDGAKSVGTRTGKIIPQSIHAYHKTRGWAGIGYNFVIDNVTGEIFEGRGWNLVGAHCPNHNRSGIGVQVHTGGNDKPSTVALASLARLYHEANRRTGRTLTRKGHRDGYATECPGDALQQWVTTPLAQPTPPTTTVKAIMSNLTLNIDTTAKHPAEFTDSEWRVYEIVRKATLQAIKDAVAGDTPDRAAILPTIVGKVKNL